MEIKEVDDCTIYKVVHGSHAYGFATEDSDQDIRGICIPHKEYFLSMDKRFELQSNTLKLLLFLTSKAVR